MDNKRLAEIKARCDATTSAPWELTHINVGGNEPGEERIEPNVVFLRRDDGVVIRDIFLADEGDCDFIAHARQDVPDLLAEVERLRARNTLLRTALDSTRNMVQHLNDPDEIMEFITESLEEAGDE